jgi:hypothetical protein
MQHGRHGVTTSADTGRSAWRVARKNQNGRGLARREVVGGHPEVWELRTAKAAIGIELRQSSMQHDLALVAQTANELSQDPSLQIDLRLASMAEDAASKNWKATKASGGINPRSRVDRVAGWRFRLSRWLPAALHR